MTWRPGFDFVSEAMLMAMNDFSFLLSGKPFLSPSILKDGSPRQRVHSVQYFPSALWIDYPVPFRPTRILLKNMLIPLRGSFCLTPCFSLAAFKLLFLSSTFDYDASQCGSLYIGLLWYFLGFSGLDMFLSPSWEHFQPLFIWISFCPFLSVSLLGLL